MKGTLAQILPGSATPVSLGLRLPGARPPHGVTWQFSKDVMPDLDMAMDPKTTLAWQK